MRLSPFIKASGLLGVLFLAVSQLIYFFLPGAPFLIFSIHFALAAFFLGLFLIKGGLLLFKNTLKLRDRSRRVRSFLKLLLILLIVGFLNAFIVRNEIFELDSTAAQIHSLSSESKKIVEKLPGKLSISAFYLGGVIPDEFIRAQLKALQKAGVDVSTIDPEVEPLKLEKFGITQQETLYFSLILPNGEERVARAAHVKTEDQLNLVLKKLTRTSSRLILYSTGHGEPALDDKLEKGGLFFKEALEGENLEVKSVSLASVSRIEDSTVALIINSPIDNFSEAERKIIAEYISRGGNLILFNEVRHSQEIALLARPFGIEVGEDMILEVTPNAGIGIESRLSEFSKDSPITKSFTRGAVFTGSTSVRLAKEADRERTFEIAYSSKSSWAERNLGLLFSKTPLSARELEDIPGPVPVAATYDGRKQGSRLKSRVVVFGDSDFIKNAHLRELSNGDLILNSINWILGDDQALLTNSRSLAKTIRKLTYEERSQISLVGGILVPELLALLSLGIWYRRQ